MKKNKSFNNTTRVSTRNSVMASDNLSIKDNVQLQEDMILKFGSTMEKLAIQRRKSGVRTQTNKVLVKPGGYNCFIGQSRNTNTETSISTFNIKMSNQTYYVSRAISTQ